MAFWGVEVKPGKPFTHSCEKARGRLRISQATLGISVATKKTIVQCNVGKRSPVLVCALLPNNTESCHLDLEFQEADDVIFSVLGPQSVYLTGYYVDRSQQFNTHSDTESFGVDIQNSHTEESGYSKDDDNYEDSFIDDGEVQVFPSSPVSSEKEIGLGILNKNIKKNINDNRKQRKKKPKVILSESEDEDGYLLSIFNDKKPKEKTMMDVGKNCAKEITEINATIKKGGLKGSKTMSKADSLDMNDEAEREAKLQVNNERKRLLEEDGTHEEAVAYVKKIVSKDIHGNKSEEESVDVTRDLPKKCEEDQIQPPDVVKAKRKKKVRHTRELEVCEAVPSDLVNCSVLSPKSGPENVQKPKKRRKDIKHEDIVEKCANVEDVISKQLLVNADHMPDLVLTNTEFQKENNDKKTKRKRSQKKNEVEEKGDHSVLNGENAAVKCDDHSPVNTVTDTRRTLSNGLIIEEVSSGRPDGKVASSGKKVKICYTTMLKDGCVFDSNVGKTPCKFVLGEKEVGEGWNTGIEGMRVGDKRRLIIPPAMGHGKHGFGENVPPNSWIVSEVELVWISR